MHPIPGYPLGMSELTFLRRLDAWLSLTPKEAQRLLKGTERCFFPAGHRILKRGDPGEAMYVIATGKVEIRVLDDDSRPRFTTHMEAGDLFGEMSLLTGEPRSADVIAAEDCECLVIPKDKLESSLRDHPSLASFLSYIVSRRILESDALRTVGKYHILGELGQGSMAIVFEGFHPGLSRRVAIKMLSHALLYTSDIRQRFVQEAKVLASLRHENIVQILDTEEGFGTRFLVMEFIEGHDLEKTLTISGPLDYVEARRAAHDVAAALAHAHRRGVVHRDVKPANIVRDKRGRCRLTDFGIATSDVHNEHGGELFCSPAYVAPEAVEGANVDGRADLYSLGATIYRLLTGKSPFPYTDPEMIFEAHKKEPFPELVRDDGPVPEDIAWLLRMTTAKRPDDRVQSAEEIVRRLAPRLTAPRGEDTGILQVRATYPEAVVGDVGRAVEAFADQLRRLGVEPDVSYPVDGESES